MESNERLNVVMVTNAVSPDKLGGLERYVSDLAGQLVRSGATVRVVAKQISGEHPLRETMAEGFDVSRFPVPTKRNPFFLALYPIAVWRGTERAVREHLRLHPEAVIHGHYALSMVPLMIRKHKYVYTFHAPVHKEIVSERQGSYLLPRILQRLVIRVVRGVESRVLKRASRIVVLSEFMRREVLELCPGSEVEALVVPGGIDLRKFHPGLPGSQAMYVQDPTIFVARRLVARTGVEQIVEAMPAVVKKYPNVVLKISGSGPREKAIRDMVVKNDLSRNVVLLGRISDEELITQFRESTICVTPSQELEGFGLSTAEALACGTPALVTPVGANPEVVSLLSPYLVTRDKTAASIAAQLVQLLDSPAELQSIRERAAAYAERFGWSHVAESYADVYLGFLGQLMRRG